MFAKIQTFLYLYEVNQLNSSSIMLSLIQKGIDGVGRNLLTFHALAWAVVAYSCNHENTVIMGGFGIIFFLSIGMLIYSWVKSRLTISQLFQLWIHPKFSLIDSISALLWIVSLTVCPLLPEAVRISLSFIALAVAVIAIILAFCVPSRNS